MDLLMTCARTFDKLIGYEYHFILGRKGKLKEINLKFSDTDFHHLAGLHKLRDIDIARANRSNVFQRILDGRITYATLTKSQFLPKIQSRLNALPNLEALLDGTQLVQCTLEYSLDRQNGVEHFSVFHAISLFPLILLSPISPCSS